MTHAANHLLHIVQNKEYVNF